MKKFRYRLQRILSLKQTLKRQAQKDLARAESERLKQEQILKTLEDELAARLQKDRSTRLKKINVQKLAQTQRYVSQLKFLIGHQKKVIREALRKVEQKRKKLIEASKEERKYERLREIRKEEYNRELELALQKETDEFAGNVYLQNQK